MSDLTSIHAYLGQLASYNCHKTVKAARIIDVDLPRHILTVEDSTGTAVENIVGLPAKFFNTHDVEGGEVPTPGPGDYLVVYEDEYTSWSPKKAFEDGYTLAILTTDNKDPEK